MCADGQTECEPLREYNVQAHAGFNTVRCYQPAEEWYICYIEGFRLNNRSSSSSALRGSEWIDEMMFRPPEKEPVTCCGLSLDDAFDNVGAWTRRASCYVCDSAGKPSHAPIFLS